jgi:hypothetical protein
MSRQWLRVSLTSAGFPATRLKDIQQHVVSPALDVPITNVSVAADPIKNTMNISRTVCIRCFLPGLLVILASGSPMASAQQPTGSIKDMMSPEEFRSAGLNKLSPEELEKLDAWLQGYRETTEKTTEKRVEKQVKRSFFKWEPIVSRVDGSFSGLRGRTVIKLEDGTMWKQANSDDHYGPSPIDHPGAAVIHTGLGYKMRIQGVPEFYVNPVPAP